MASPLIIQREATGWVASFGTLFLDEPADWRRNQRDIWHCCPRRAWTPRPHIGHELFAGDLRLSTFAPRNGRDGWCWYASVECQHGEGGSIASRQGYETEGDAQAAAVAFVKSFCSAILGALPAEG